MKQFIIGFTAGAVIFGAAGVFATEYIIEPNPYPIKVEDTNVSIDGYNIDGYSYFKLRDIGEQVGFNVDFQNDTIIINKESQPDISPLPEGFEPLDEIPPQATELNEKFPAFYEHPYGLTSDGIPITVIDGKQYVSTVAIDEVYSIYDYFLGFTEDQLLEFGGDIALDNVQKTTSYIEYEYYETTLLPYIRIRCQN